MRVKRKSRESGIAVVKVSIYRWRKIKQNTDNVKPRTGYQKGHSHAIKDREVFKTFLDQNSDKTLQELSRIWPEKASPTTIHRAIKKLGYSIKKLFIIRKGMLEQEKSLGK